MVPQGTFDALEQSKEQRLARENRTQLHVTAAEFRQHLRQVSQAVTVVCSIVIAFVAISAGFDIHTIRLARVDEVNQIAELMHGLFSRLDAQGWRMDTQAEITGATNKILADALVRMRAQVKLNTDSSQRQATATTTIAREAVKQSAATTQLVQQVAAAPDPIVNVEMPKAAPPAVVVQAPAAVARPVPAAPPAVRILDEPAKRDRFSWLKFWRWGRHGGAKQ